MTQNIRKVKQDDLDDILRLLYQLSPKKPDENVSIDRLNSVMLELIKSYNHYMVTYEDGNKVVGTATLVVLHNLSHGARPYGHIENVVVDEKYRGKGIGKALVDYLVMEAKNRGCYKVLLNCSAKNVPFYEKCNFKKTGEVEVRVDL